MCGREAQPFVKYHSLGNDFVFFDWRQKERDAVLATVRDPAWPGHVQKLCRRHFGVGANGVLVLLQPNQLLIFNEDGSAAETCLNGLRCAADYLFSDGPVQIRMGQRVCVCSSIDGEIVSDVGAVACLGEESFLLARKELSGYRMTVGNPHFVIMEKTSEAWLARYGQRIESHELFPQRTNVEFVWPSEEKPFSYHVLVYERGCGPTLACGSGAAAITGLLVHLGRVAIGQKIVLQMLGGPLTTWVEPSGHVMLQARAQNVFTGLLQ